MMIEAHQVRYLFHPDEVLAAAELLSLPCAGLKNEDAPWRIENGKALLEMNGHLQRNESGKPALSYELAFLHPGGGKAGGNLPCGNGAEKRQVGAGAFPHGGGNESRGG